MHCITASTWNCQHQLELGQTAVDSKKNEITAIPELLTMLDRALQIYSYLFNRGIAKERLIVISLGEKAPVSFLETKEAVELNQSVEIIEG